MKKKILFLILFASKLIICNEPPSEDVAKFIDDIMGQTLGCAQVSEETEKQIRAIAAKIVDPDQKLLIRRLSYQIIHSNMAMHPSLFSQHENTVVFTPSICPCLYVNEDAFNALNDTEKEFVIVKEIMRFVLHHSNTLNTNIGFSFLSLVPCVIGTLANLNNRISQARQISYIGMAYITPFIYLFLSQNYLLRNLDKEAERVAVAELKTNEGALSYYKKLQAYKKKCKLDLPPNQRSRWKLTKLLSYPFTWRHTYNHKIQYLSEA